MISILVRNRNRTALLRG